LMLTAALEGRIALQDVVPFDQWHTSAYVWTVPAQGHHPARSHGDLCLYDPRGTTILRHEQMWSKARDIDKLYLDRAFRGHVVATLLAGRVIFREGDVLAPRGSGGFLAPLPTT
ncbi:MAG: hypothetical protein HC914_06210, partial [Chloroflexaceae bacterium]|nr:hypothetical protein [Chloroflexaceae bacterium]